MPDNQIADTEVGDSKVDDSKVDEEGDDAVDPVAETDREKRLRALAAIHGDVGDDLLPGVEPIVDDAVFVGEWPYGWVTP